MIFLAKKIKNENSQELVCESVSDIQKRFSQYRVDIEKCIYIHTFFHNAQPISLSNELAFFLPTACTVCRRDLDRQSLVPDSIKGLNELYTVQLPNYFNPREYVFRYIFHASERKFLYTPLSANFWVGNLISGSFKRANGSLPPFPPSTRRRRERKNRLETRPPPITLDRPITELLLTYSVRVYVIW